MSDKTADMLRATLISPNVWDSNGEPANVVDGLFAIARALAAVADALNRRAGEAMPGLDITEEANDSVDGRRSCGQPLDNDAREAGRDLCFACYCLEQG
jgi:hypothetical protein